MQGVRNSSGGFSCPPVAVIHLKGDPSFEAVLKTWPEQAFFSWFALARVFGETNQNKQHSFLWRPTLVICLWVRRVRIWNLCTWVMRKGLCWLWGQDPVVMGETIFNGRASPPWVACSANPTDLCHEEKKLWYLVCTHPVWPQLVC